MRSLLICGHSPLLTDFGGAQRSNLIYRVLRSLGEVDILLVGPSHAPGRSVVETHGKPEGRMEFVMPLTRGQRWPWKIIRPLSPPHVDKVAHNLGRRIVDYQRNPAVGAVFDRLAAERKYDLVVGRYLKYPSQAGARMFTPSIFDLDDNDIDLYRSIADDPSTAPLRRFILRSRVHTLERIVPQLVANPTCLWVTKEEDLSLPGFARAIVLPNIPFVKCANTALTPLPADPSSKVVMFVGMLNFLPNMLGIVYFLENVWPLVRQAVPDAVFRIVGSRISLESRRLWGAVEGVEIVGFVEDIREAYRMCAFTVVPIWQGAGTNIKVLESLACGRTTVLSALAHRGYERSLPNNQAVLVGKTPAELAHHCVRMLRQPELRQKMAQLGANLVAQYYSFENFTKIVLETVSTAVESSSSRKAFA